MIIRLPIEEDGQVLTTFAESFDTIFRDVESLAISLENNTNDGESLLKLIACISKIYQSAISTNLAPLVEPLETIQSCLKGFSTSNLFPPQFSQLLLMFMDRLQVMVHQAAESQSVDFTLIKVVQEAIVPVSRLAENHEQDSSIAKAMRLLMGEFVAADETMPDVELFFDQTYANDQPALRTPLVVRPHVFSTKSSVVRILAETIDNRHRYWVGRTEFILPMAIGMNAVADNSVDLLDLEAAVCLHDFSMVRLSDELLYAKSLEADQLSLMRSHPVLAYELIVALEYSDACARIVYQHHERPDGDGYPDGLRGDSICPGAKILAICDAFYAMTHARPQKEDRRGLLRAIAEINACRGTQFDPAWVDCFNVVVRTERLAGTW